MAKRKKKYLFGGALMPIALNLGKNLLEDLLEKRMGGATFEQVQNSQAFGNFKLGGTVPVEVEGQEGFELPNGITGQFSGPSHAAVV